MSRAWAPLRPSLVPALVRPVAIVAAPAGQMAILPATDVSRSMCATDILPNRLESAKAAALAFVQSQPASAQIGLVAFAGFAQIVQMPTNDQEIVQDAIISLVTGRRTAIGSGILKSVNITDAARPKRYGLGLVRWSGAAAQFGDFWYAGGHFLRTELQPYAHEQNLAWAARPTGRDVGWRRRQLRALQRPRHRR